jgi:predicted metal-dependent HD superfamily phosphohydrolase
MTLQRQLAHQALANVLDAQNIDTVLACYEEPWRAYHGLKHVLGLFAFAAEHQFVLSPSQALAVLFHDAVYIPGAGNGDNERASAALLRLLCSRLQADVVAEAQQIVLDTIAHTPSCEASRLVLDLDLSPFIMAARGQLDPSADVWLEYRPLLPAADSQAQQVFWPARTKILAMMLDKKVLYTSTEFKSRPEFEALAREHLTQEIANAAAMLEQLGVPT